MSMSIPSPNQNETDISFILLFNYKELYFSIDTNFLFAPSYQYIG